MSVLSALPWPSESSWPNCLCVRPLPPRNCRREAATGGELREAATGGALREAATGGAFRVSFLRSLQSELCFCEQVIYQVFKGTYY